MERLNKETRVVRLPPRAPANPSRYLAVATMIKNEGRYLRIVNPAAITAVYDAHMLETASGSIGRIDERRTTVSVGTRDDPPPGAVLRINHYYTRSRREFAHKSNRLDNAWKRPRRADLIETETVRDDTILRFLPGLQPAHELRAEGRVELARQSSR